MKYDADLWRKRVDPRGGVVLLFRELVINAAGPWADLVLGDTESAQKLMRSKGVHIITRSLTTGHALAIASDGGHFFVLPWRGHSMLLTGRLPFDGGSIAEVCSQVLLEPARSPLLLRPDLPPALCDVVLRCLSKDREQRFATAEALAEALLGSLPPQAVTSTFTRRSAP